MHQPQIKQKAYEENLIVSRMLDAEEQYTLFRLLIHDAVMANNPLTLAMMASRLTSVPEDARLQAQRLVLRVRGPHLATLRLIRSEVMRAGPKLEAAGGDYLCEVSKGLAANDVPQEAVAALNTAANHGSVTDERLGDVCFALVRDHHIQQALGLALGAKQFKADGAAASLRIWYILVSYASCFRDVTLRNTVEKYAKSAIGADTALRLYEARMHGAELDVAEAVDSYEEALEHNATTPVMHYWMIRLAPYCDDTWERADAAWRRLADKDMTPHHFAALIDAAQWENDADALRE